MFVKFSIQRTYRSSQGLHTDTLYSGETVAKTLKQAECNAWHQAAVAKKWNVAKFYIEHHDNQDYRCKLFTAVQGIRKENGNDY